jgi:hypothetical protein
LLLEARLVFQYSNPEDSLYEKVRLARLEPSGRLKLVALDHTKMRFLNRVPVTATLVTVIPVPGWLLDSSNPKG